MEVVVADVEAKEGKDAGEGNTDEVEKEEEREFEE